ncbi:hypothetical protein Tco_0156279 [Tanacetum coccineum]
MISPKRTWKPKGNYLDSVNRGNGSYTLKQFEYVTPLGQFQRRSQGLATMNSGCSSGKYDIRQGQVPDFKEFKGAQFLSQIKNVLSSLQNSRLVDEISCPKAQKLGHRKRGEIYCKGKEHVSVTLFTLSTANTPPQSTGNTPTDSDDDTSTMVFYLYKLFLIAEKAEQSLFLAFVHLHGLLLSIRWMSKEHFCSATSQTRYNVDDIIFGITQVFYGEGLEDLYAQGIQDEFPMGELTILWGFKSSNRLVDEAIVLRFSCRITPLTPSYVRSSHNIIGKRRKHRVLVLIILGLQDSARDAFQALQTKVLAQSQKCCYSKRTASVQGTASFHDTVNSQGTAEIQRTADFQGTDDPHDAAIYPKSPNVYTPTQIVSNMGGDRTFKMDML